MKCNQWLEKDQDKIKVLGAKIKDVLRLGYWWDASTLVPPTLRGSSRGWVCSIPLNVLERGDIAIFFSHTGVSSCLDHGCDWISYPIGLLSGCWVYSFKAWDPALQNLKLLSPYLKCVKQLCSLTVQKDVQDQVLTLLAPPGTYPPPSNLIPSSSIVPCLSQQSGICYSWPG